MKLYQIIFLTIFFLALQISISLAETITTVVVKEKAGITTANYPLTFAIPFRKGDVTEGIVVEHEGKNLPTQFDIKRTWANGSVKHGIISVVIPRVDANSTETLIIKTGLSNSQNGVLDKDAILATDVESKINLTNLSGSNNPTSASASLRSAISDGNIEYWMKGPVCTEILEDMKLTPNDNLHARWEARFYPGTSFGIRISNIVESVNISAMGMSHYDVAIVQGKSNPAQVYSFSDYSHSYGSRWRKTFWIGAEPPKTVLSYDTSYLIGTKMIPSLDTELPIDNAEIDRQYNLLTGPRSSLPGETGTTIYGYRGGNDIDGAGCIMRAGATPGGRPDLGVIPTWTAFHLLYYNEKTDALLKENGNIAGHVGSLHYRESDPVKQFYGKPLVALTDRPGISISTFQDGGNYGDLPAPIGAAPNNPNEWNPDRAHQGDYIYTPYLLTGEHYYMDELMYWGGWTAAYQAWGRNGNNSTQNFSSEFPEGLAAGIIHDETRAVAWGLRTLNNAAVILPDSESVVASYFRKIVSNNIHWLALGNTAGITANGLFFMRAPREEEWEPSNAVTNHRRYQAPWMHDFNVLVMTDMIRKEEGVTNLSELLTLHNNLGSFTVGRFTAAGFNKFDGCGFYWPISKRKPDINNFYQTSETWADFYTDLKDNDQLMGPGYTQGIPHDNYSRYQGDAESYLYLAKSTLAGLVHLPGGTEAYNFVKSQCLVSGMSHSPNWGGLVPDGGFIPPQCNDTPLACLSQSECELNNWFWCDNQCQKDDCNITIGSPHVLKAFIKILPE